MVKPTKVPETVWVYNSRADGLGYLPCRDDLLDQRFNLFSVGRHGYFLDCDNETRDMPCTQALTNGVLQRVLQTRRENMCIPHDYEQEDRFIGIKAASLSTYTERGSDGVGEWYSFCDGVDLCRAEAYTLRIEHAVTVGDRRD